MGTQEILQRKGWKVKRKASGGKSQLRTQVDTLSDTNATTSVSLDDEYSSKKGGKEVQKKGALMVRREVSERKD